ncbi:MAG TPA: histidine phosphatase family protein [Roseiflexaceae bacterium]|nr:histidine phosphatase family protein [Roseiflexaceae bacterium]HMP41527.1 histidine phosphatase family protein [Roseiflexaceae bacterium]
MRTSVWLVRHGQTTYNRERRYQGQADSPLTTYGRAQAAALARRLVRQPFSHAFVSPSSRASDTAAAILAGRTITAVGDARWAETAHGRWEGLTYAEVVARFREEAARRFADPLHGRAEGGESLVEVHQRVAAAWNDLLRDHPGGRILVVSHATPIQLILCAVGNLPPSQHWRWRIDLGSLTVLDVYSSGPIVRMVNMLPPLRG